MKIAKWQRIIGRTCQFIALALVLSVQFQCAGSAAQWRILQVTVPYSLPQECAFVGGFGLDVFNGQADTPPVQPAGGATFLSQNAPGNNFWYQFYKCGVAEVVLERLSGLPATVVGDPVNLSVTHFHQTWVPVLGGKDPDQSLSYTTHIATNGQTQITFPRVVVVSTDEKTGQTSGYDNLQGMGGIPVRFGQWPFDAIQGSGLVQRGSLVPQDCTFFSGSSGVSCQ